MPDWEFDLQHNVLAEPNKSEEMKGRPTGGLDIYAM
jgi:hypothetical protein